MEELLFTIDQTAKILKTTKNRVYSLINGGYIRAMKLGHLKVPKKEIIVFLDNNIGLDMTDLSNIQKLDVGELAEMQISQNQ